MPTDGTQNFRLRGIPREYKTKNDVRQLVERILSVEPGDGVIIYSLATSPAKRTSQVATLRFTAIPQCLSDSSRNEWVFDLPAEDDSDVMSRIVLDTHFTGFTPLQRTIDERYDVDFIAVSGLGGHAFGTFKERQGTFMWLRDALPSDVPMTRILIYGYDSGLVRSSSFQNLSDLGRALHTDLRGIRSPGSSRPIVFIGHSLGGLVIKETIVYLKEEASDANTSILNAVRGFMFFGVPHQGLAVESLIPLVQDQPNRSLLESLSKNSALLQRLDKDFARAISGRGSHIVSFFETKESPTAVKNTSGRWELSGPSRVLVDVSSAKCGSDRDYPLERDHSGMVKYSSEHDILYGRVTFALQDLLETAKVTLETPITTVVSPRAPIFLPTESKDCLRSLSFPEQEYRYNEIHSAKNTCEWLLQDHRYRAWLNNSHGLLWIKGKPGAGKSVLMKHAVTTMVQRKPADLVASFFVHGRGVALQKTPLGMFRALLNSILPSFPQYLSQLTKRFNDRDMRRGSYFENRWHWAEKELQDLLSEVLIQGIFIDALDEAGESHARSLLAYFKSIMEDIDRGDALVKICFSSRHYPILGHETMATVLVEEKNENDIRVVVGERLREIQPPLQRQQFESGITMKAHGGFQWAILIVSKLLEEYSIGTRSERLQEMLTATPEALQDLYAGLLSDLSKGHRHRMTKLFQWVLFAKRPLSSQELREALATDEDMNWASVSQLRHHGYWADTTAQFEKVVSHISRGLIEFQTRELWEHYDDADGWDREAQFIHQSASDYLLERFIKPNRYGSTAHQSGHFMLSRSCLRYLTLREIHENDQLSRRKLSGTFPLLPYAVQFLLSHVQESEQAGIPQLDLVEIMHWKQPSKTLKNISSMWRVMDPENAHCPQGWPFIGASPLHLMIGFGLKSSLSPFLRKEDAELEVRDMEGNTPLLLALREERQDMALLLLAHSIQRQLEEAISNFRLDKVQGSFRLDVAKKDGHSDRHLRHVNIANHDDETPLVVACSVNARDAILQLIDTGANLGDSASQVQLVFYAIHRRDTKLLAMLLEKGVELDGALFFAATELSHECDPVLLEMISKLIMAGGNTTKSVYSERTSSNDEDHDDMSEFDDDGDDDAEDNSANEVEAMVVASRRGNTEAVSLLLEHGAAADVRDSDGAFPLLAAARNGHTETVRLLLRHAPETATMRNYSGRTAFDEAASESFFESAVMLLREGTLVAATVSSINIVLFYSEIDGIEDIIASASQGSIVLEMTNYEHANEVFLWAANRGHESVLNLLFDTDGAWIDVNARDERWRTPLILAVERGNEAFVKCLLNRNGADVNLPDQDGNTPLALAVMGKHEKITNLLLESFDIDITMRSKAGLSPISKGLQLAQKEITQILITARNEYGDAPLLRATQQRGGKAREQCLGIKLADINATDNFGDTELRRAVRIGWNLVSRLLLDTTKPTVVVGDSSNSANFFKAFKRGRLETANLPNVHEVDQYDLTPIALATWKGHDTAVKSLLDTGKVSVHSKYSSCFKIFSWAAGSGYDTVISILLDMSTLEVDESDGDGDDGDTSPLSAVQEGRGVMVKFRLDSVMVDWNRRNSRGRAPFACASRNNDLAVVELLLFL